MWWYCTYRTYIRYATVYGNGIQNILSEEELFFCVVVLCQTLTLLLLTYRTTDYVYGILYSMLLLSLRRRDEACCTHPIDPSHTRRLRRVPSNRIMGTAHVMVKPVTNKSRRNVSLVASLHDIATLRGLSLINNIMGLAPVRVVVGGAGVLAR